MMKASLTFLIYTRFRAPQYIYMYAPFDPTTGSGQNLSKDDGYLSSVQFDTAYPDHSRVA
jgi:hypothetical protein